jgi:hypothetical protein
MSKYRLERAILDENWDSFIGSSPSGTIFSNSYFLKLFSINIHAYYCYKNNEIMGAVLCVTSPCERKIIGHDYIIHDGLIYKDLSYLNRSQRYSEEYKIQEFVSNKLPTIYKCINFKLSTYFVDIRAFQWFNYHNDGLKYQIKASYTSLVDISDFPYEKDLNKISIYKNASSARRQQIRYAIKKQVSTTLTNDADSFVSFYNKTMINQNIFLPSSKLNEIKFLIKELLKADLCIMVKSSTLQGVVGSMAVFLLDDKKSYYLFGANDPKFRDQHTGTAILWDSFYILSERGYNTIDLEGINSPNRGWFKTSFGGIIEPYYQVSYG